MDINKAIKKQKRSYKRFMLIMGFIFFLLPMILLILRIYNVFYISYVIIVELLIIIAVGAKINKERLNFHCNNLKIRIISGVRGNSLIIPCNKVALVHVENIEMGKLRERDFSIILIFSNVVRNKRIFKINKTFLVNHPYVAFRYYKLKLLNPDKMYSFSVIKRGKLYKHQLLDLIYKNCVNAIFTESAVDKIKEYRNYQV